MTINVNPSFKDMSSCGTWATNKLEALAQSKNGKVKHVAARCAAPFTAVPFAADALLHTGMAIGKGATALVFKVIETLGAILAQDMDLSKSSGLTHFTYNETVGHLSRVGSDVISMGTAVAGLVNPKITVAAARALGSAKKPSVKVENRGRARRVFDFCVGKSSSAYKGAKGAAGWVKAHPYQTAGWIAAIAAIGAEEYKYGCGMGLAQKSWEYVPARPEFIDNSASYVADTAQSWGSKVLEYVPFIGGSEEPQVYGPSTSPTPSPSVDASSTSPTPTNVAGTDQPWYSSIFG